MHRCPCTRLLAVHWADSGEGLNNVTLRFSNLQTEAGFLAQREASLIQGATKATACLIAIALFTLALCGIIMSNSHGIALQLCLVQFYATCAVFVVSCLFVTAIQCKQLQPFSIEVSTVVLMIIGMLTPLLSTAKLTRVLGYSLTEVHGHDAYASDSACVLLIDGVVSIGHLVPVRWHVMFPAEVAAVLGYLIVAVFVGSDEPMQNWLFNLVLLVSLIVASALAKRAHERCERLNFQHIIEEKSRRCAAEYQLSCTEGKPEGPPPILCLSEYKPRSKPESITGKSADVFNLKNQGRTDLSVQLARIAELGESEHWRIDEREVKILHDVFLGCGGFGMVVKGIFCGMMVAVKFPMTQLESRYLLRLPELCNELRVLRHLRHPHVVATHGAIINPQQHRIALVLELVQGVILDKFMERGGSGECSDAPSPLARYQIMLGVCRALVYMHTRRPPVVHGDIKSGNVMVELSGHYVHPKLLDFGLSRLLVGRPHPLSGTLAWMAPEVLLESGQVERSADIYSFGRLLAFVATGQAPLTDIPDGMLRHLLAQGRPPLPTWPRCCIFERSCKSLVHSCLHAEEGARPSIAEVLETLLGLPDVLRLDDANGEFLTDTQIVASHSGQSQPPSRSLSGSEIAACPSTLSRLTPVLPQREPILPNEPREVWGASEDQAL